MLNVSSLLDANINQQTLGFYRVSAEWVKSSILLKLHQLTKTRRRTLYNSFAELQSFMLQKVMVENQNAWITCDSKTHVQTLQAIPQ